MIVLFWDVFDRDRPVRPAESSQFEILKRFDSPFMLGH